MGGSTGYARHHRAPQFDQRLHLALDDNYGSRIPIMSNLAGTATLLRRRRGFLLLNAAVLTKGCEIWDSTDSMIGVKFPDQPRGEFRPRKPKIK